LLRILKTFAVIAPLREEFTLTDRTVALRFPYLSLISHPNCTSSRPLRLGGDQEIIVCKELSDELR
jgi:hypothetical protein